MPDIDLTGKRVLLLGAETDVGSAVAAALAEAGASVALVAAANDAEAAFAVQRLARRLTSPGRKMISQAIDATSEMGVRVMVRQVSKELGGLDVIVSCLLAVGLRGGTDALRRATEIEMGVINFAGREFARRRVSGRVVAVWAGKMEFGQPFVSHYTSPSSELRPGSSLSFVAMEGKMPQTIATEVLIALADAADTR